MKAVLAAAVLAAALAVGAAQKPPSAAALIAKDQQMSDFWGYAQKVRGVGVALGGWGPRRCAWLGWARLGLTRGRQPTPNRSLPPATPVHRLCQFPDTKKILERMGEQAGTVFVPSNSVRGGCGAERSRRLQQARPRWRQLGRGCRGLGAHARCPAAAPAPAGAGGGHAA